MIEMRDGQQSAGSPSARQNRPAADLTASRCDEHDSRQDSRVEQTVSSRSDQAFSSSGNRMAEFILTNNVEDIHDLNKGCLARNNDLEFFNGLEWYRLFSEHCLPAEHTPIFLSGIEGDGSASAGFALCLCSPVGQPGTCVSTTLFRDRTASSMTNYQTGRYAPVITTGRPTAELVSLMAKGIREKLSDYAMLDFTHCDPRSNASKTLADACNKAGFSTYRYPYDDNIYEDVGEASFEEYLSKRSRNFRYNLKRYEKNLGKIGDIEYVIRRDNADIDVYLEHYQQVFDASWKEPEPFPMFSREIMKAAARCGTMRLGLLFLDGKPISTQFWIVSGGRATIYKLHYNEQYSMKYGVGYLLTVKMAKDAIETDKVGTIDFGTGGQDYKKSFLFEEDQLGGLVAFNRGTTAGRLLELEYRLRLQARAVKNTLKKLARQLPIRRSV